MSALKSRTSREKHQLCQPHSDQRTGFQPRDGCKRLRMRRGVADPLRLFAMHPQDMSSAAEEHGLGVLSKHTSDTKGPVGVAVSHSRPPRMLREAEFFLGESASQSLPPCAIGEVFSLEQKSSWDILNPSSILLYSTPQCTKGSFCLVTFPNLATSKEYCSSSRAAIVDEGRHTRRIAVMLVAPPEVVLVHQ